MVGDGKAVSFGVQTQDVVTIITHNFTHAVILAHNEIDILEKCIDQLSFCDEVIVIDYSLTY